MPRPLIGLVLLPLLAFASCGGGDSAGNASCRGIYNRYEDCGVWIGGNKTCHALPERNFDECFAKCVDDASCSAIADYACNAVPNPCMSDCLYDEAFTCDNDRDILLLQQCDGVPDCSDGSDEDGCEPTIWRCYEFPPREEISGSLVCNGTAECDNSSDEEDCGGYICGSSTPSPLPYTIGQ